MADHSASRSRRAPAQDVLVVPVRRLPVAGRSGELALEAEVLAARVDPAAEPVPFGEERFMGDGDGRAPA